MAINDIILYIIIVFLILGAIDVCLGNKFGLGDKFKDGIQAMGPLTLAMVGIISLAPVISSLLLPLIAPVYGVIGADPSAFANTILALDMGGFALAREMSASADAEVFSWVFLGTMMGPTLSFTIPVAIGIIKREDHPYFAKGILLGIMTVPVGCLVGGLVGGLDLMMMVKNLLPTIIFSIFIALGLWKIPEKMVSGFTIFAKLIQILAIGGLTAIIIETLTGFVVIPNMAPLEEGIQIVGTIAIFLAGAFPMVAFISKAFKPLLTKLGQLLRMNSTATAGLIASLAHHIPMFVLVKDMDARGKVINIAFAVSGAFVFGSHLGFVAGMEKEMVFAMIVGKLVAGVSAILLVLVAMKGRTDQV